MRGSTRSRALGGFLVRKERWGLSVSAKVLLLLVCLVAGTAVIGGIYPFLAVTSPASQEVLIVEGWLPSVLAEEIARRFAAGRYEELIVVGGVHPGIAPYESGELHVRHVAARLQEFGVRPDRVRIVLFEHVERNRTYQSAVEVKRHLRTRGLNASSVDVLTVGPHARRSRLLFQSAFGGDVKVGVLALNDPSYDPAHWWRFSAGWREVPFECLAFVYTKWIFWPPSD